MANAIQHIASTGCRWSRLPCDFPPFTTVQRTFYDWRDGGLLRAINHLPVVAARELEGARSQSDGRRDRQRERQNDGKRRPPQL